MAPLDHKANPELLVIQVAQDQLDLLDPSDPLALKENLAPLDIQAPLAPLALLVLLVRHTKHRLQLTQPLLQLIRPLLQYISNRPQCINRQFLSPFMNLQHQAMVKHPPIITRIYSKNFITSLTHISFPIHFKKSHAVDI